MFVACIYPTDLQYSVVHIPKTLKFHLLFSELREIGHNTRSKYILLTI